MIIFFLMFFGIYFSMRSSSIIFFLILKLKIILIQIFKQDIYIKYMFIKKIFCFLNADILKFNYFQYYNQVEMHFQ